MQFFIDTLFSNDEKDFLKEKYNINLKNITTTSKVRTILDDYHISTKKEWHAFLRQHHSDKINHDPAFERCSDDDLRSIILIGKQRGW